VAFSLLNTWVGNEGDDEESLWDAVSVIERDVPKDVSSTLVSPAR
jgi:hypothetical protein